MKKIQFAFVCSLILISSCSKEEVRPGSYTGQFWGYARFGDQQGTQNVLNVPIELSQKSESLLVFNDSLNFELRNDSIFGVFEFSEVDYLMDPYLVGTFWRVHNNCFFTGQYAAVIDSTTPVKGVFSIQSAD